MEEQSTWFVDLEKLSKDLSVAAGRDQSTWNWSQMRDMLEAVFSNPSPEITHYLVLTRRDPSDAESTRDLVTHFREDLPRWFQVVIAPALSPAGSIARYPSLLPRMLEAYGWDEVDAVAVLMGDPLASLAQEIGLSLIASQLAETQLTGWLSANRVADLNSKLHATISEPTEAVLAAVAATAAYWTQDEVGKAARETLNDARAILERADTAHRPLVVRYDV